MDKYTILVLDDDPSVIEKLSTELDCFSSFFDIKYTQTIRQANKVIKEVAEHNQEIALIICDDELDGRSGIDYLIKLSKVGDTQASRKILITNNIQDRAIIEAVNTGRLDYCLHKPWETRKIVQLVQRELTTYILNDTQADWLSYRPILDENRLVKAYLDLQGGSYRSGFLNYEEMSEGELADKLIEGLFEFFEDNDEFLARRTYSANHTLTKEGEQNEYLWFIVEGCVALSKLNEDGDPVEVSRHERGGLIGGMTFISAEPSFSTSTTLCKTKVIKLDKLLFAKVMHSHSNLLPLFTNLLLSQSNVRVKEATNTELQLQNTLKKLSATQIELVNREKMATLGELVAGVAHELNNPIAAILRGADTIRESIGKILTNSLSDEQKKKGFDILQEALNQAPQSTSDIRRKTKEVTQLLEDRQLAKKAVTIGLDQPDEIAQWLSAYPGDKNELLQQWGDYHQTGNFLRSINVCASRIVDLVKSLKSHARQDQETVDTVDLREGLEDTLVIFENRLKRIELERDYKVIPELRCHPIALQQVWTNLISNALDATDPKTGYIKVATDYLEEHNPPLIEICVEDNGEGIDEEKQKKIFELNYTTKREGNFGLGIGLSVCKQIVEHHSGTISVISDPNDPELNTKMVVRLPISQSLNETNL